MKRHIVGNSAVLVLVLVIAANASAQIVSTDSTLSLSGLVEAYYLYDFGQPPTNNRPSFLYNHTRTNEISINLAFLKLHYEGNLARANLALMTGTYAQANLASEPPLWRNVFEANVGARIVQSANVWADAGVFPSHIGFESAIGKDSWTLTRSVLAENSPYYESGLRVTYTTSDNSWTLCGHVLNGWQQIQRPAGHSGLCWGTQVIYQPNQRVLLNSSTFIGNTKPDSAKQMRYFHNFYGTFGLSPSLGLTAGFDLGVEEKSGNTSGYNLWYSPVVILRYHINESMRAAARVEYYKDNDGVIIPAPSPGGFEVVGSSLNFDCSLSEHALWRLEARLLQSNNQIFVSLHGLENSNLSLATSLSVFF